MTTESDIIEKMARAIWLQQDPKDLIGGVGIMPNRFVYTAEAAYAASPMKALVEENERLRKALEFYSYDIPTLEDPVARGWFKCKIFDVNRIAKAALSQEGK